MKRLKPDAKDPFLAPGKVKQKDPDLAAPFTKLHMIQADYGDTLLLEFRETQGQEPKFWLTDTGPTGTRYSNNGFRAMEALFTVLNDFQRTGREGIGVPRLDRLILTHPHLDHIQGADSILQCLQLKWDEDADQGGEPMVRTYSWINAVMGARAGQLPWTKLWWNDKAVLDYHFPITPENNDPETYQPPPALTLENLAAGKSDPCWMRGMLNTLKFRREFERLVVARTINEEYLNLGLATTTFKNLYKPPPPAYGLVSREMHDLLKRRTPMNNVNVLLPTAAELEISQSSGSRASGRDGYAAIREKVLAGNPGKPGERWLGKTDLPTKRTGPDVSPYNCISIVHEHMNNGKKSIFMGDNVGTKVSNILASANPNVTVAKYDILKIPHHGSCYNCLTTWPPVETGRAGTNCFTYCRNFFRFFKARYYCFSGNVLSHTPNPDIYTMGALIPGYVMWGQDGMANPDPGYEETNIIVTNGISYNSYLLFKNLAGDYPQYTFNLYFMRKDCHFCSIDPVTGPDMDTVEKISTDEEFYGFYVNELTAWTEEQFKVAVPLSPESLARLSQRTLDSLENETGVTVTEGQQKPDPKGKATNQKAYMAGVMKFSKMVDRSKSQVNLAKPKNGSKNRRKSTGGQVGMICKAGQDSKPFRFPCRIGVSSRQTTVAAQADQGSDFNLISAILVKNLDLPVHELSSFANGHVYMRTVNGKQTALDAFTTVEIEVAGIRRCVDLLILPAKMEQSEVLLGLPWLLDVDASIHARKSSIEIGDRDRGETVVSIKGPQQELRGSHRFLAYPRTAIAKPESAIGSVLAIDQVSTTTVSLADVWNDFSISGFNMNDLPDWKYFDSTEPSLQKTEGEQAWVDISQFKAMLRADNALPSSDPNLAPEFFTMLDNYLPGAGLYPQGADALLGTFMSALFDPDIAAQILSALPLNPNGLLPQLRASTSRPAITLLPVHDLQFETIAADPSTGTRLEVLAIAFTLRYASNDAPSAIFANSLSAQDIFTWQLPVSNASYSRRDLYCRHDFQTGVRVKILWPFFQNRTVIAHFNSTININKSPTERITGPCTGTCYKKMNAPASYDIKIGNMDLLELFTFMHPQDQTFSSAFGSSITSLGIEALKSKIDAASVLNFSQISLVFRQGTPPFNTAALDEIYGSISFSDNPLSIDLPGVSWNLPLKDLPALRLKLGKVLELSGQNFAIALTHNLGDLGFAAIEATFSTSKMRPQFDATLLFEPGVSLGQLVEKGFGVLGPDCLDSEFLASLHLGSLSNSDVAEGVLKVLGHVYVPYARVQMSQLTSGYGLSEMEVKIVVEDLAFPEVNPVVSLQDFEITVVQQRSGATSSKDPTTTVHGLATINLGGVDANCSLLYDPITDAQISRLGIDNMSSPGYDQRLTFTVLFPDYRPTLGDLVSQVIGEMDVTTDDRTVNKLIPSALHAVLDVAALQEVQLTFARGHSQERTPTWRLATCHVEVDLLGLVDLLDEVFDIDLPFEKPTLSITVSEPTEPSLRAFEITLSSIISVSGVICTVIADLMRATVDGAMRDIITVSYAWDPLSEPLTLSHVVGHFSKIIDHDASSEAYMRSLRDGIPDRFVTLVDGVNLEVARIVLADLAVQAKTSRFGVAELFLQVADTGDPWAPFGQDWPHLTFAGTRLGYNFSNPAVGQPTVMSSTTATSVTFYTLMQLLDTKFNINFTYTRTPTAVVFSFALSERGAKMSLMTLMSKILNEDSQSAIVLPEDAGNLFDIDLTSLTITYTKCVAPTALESLALQQAGKTTFLSVSVASIALECTRASKASPWSYSLRVQLPLTAHPFAKVLPISGVEDLVVRNGYFAIFKGPPMAVPGPIAPMMNSSMADGATIYLSGALALEGNDFLSLASTILKIPAIDFAIQSGGSLDIAIPVGKLELTVQGHPIFSVSHFRLTIGQAGDSFLAGELDLMAEWLAPSIKTKSIGFRLMLGVSSDGSLDINIYAVDPVSGKAYPDMSKIEFIQSPFWIPGLVLYPFHFSMRWLAEAAVPEALAAGGGFKVIGTDMDDVFAFSIDDRYPASNYINFEIKELTLEQIFGKLIPDSETSRRLFKWFDIGFKTLKLQCSPAQRQFELYADFHCFSLQAKVYAKVDPLSGLFLSANLDPIDMAGGLLSITSAVDISQGPFIHINTAATNVLTKAAATKPPAWASVTSGSALLDNSVFALTARLEFVGLEFDVFGLLSPDDAGLILYTYAGLNEHLPGMDFGMSRQMSLMATKGKVYLSSSFNLDLELDIPEIEAMGVKIGEMKALNIKMDVEVILQVTMSDNSSFVFQAAFKTEILGLKLDVPDLQLSVTMKDLKELPDEVVTFIKDKIVHFLKDTVAKTAEEDFDSAVEAGNEAIDAMVRGFNIAEQDIAHAFREFGRDIDLLAETLRYELDLSLDEAVLVFRNLGHDISTFGTTLADVFEVSEMVVAEAAVELGLCSVEHAFIVGVKEDIDELEQLVNGTVGVANELASLGTQALQEVERAGQAIGDVERQVEMAASGMLSYLGEGDGGFLQLVVATFDNAASHCEIL